MTRPMKIGGQTWYQWACALFWGMNCDVCGKGVRGHLPCIFEGAWFALCRNYKQQRRKEG